MNVKLSQRRRILLIFRLDLQDNLVLVGARIDRRDLLRAISAVERILDLLRCDAQGRCFIAIYFDVELRIVLLNVTGHVQQSRQRLPSFCSNSSALLYNSFSIRSLQSQLIRTLGHLAAHLDQRWILQVDAHARHGGQFRPQILQ